jgi:hypothetical protein
MFRAEPLYTAAYRRVLTRIDAFQVIFGDVRRVMIPNAIVRCGETLVEGRGCRGMPGELA